MKIQSIQRKKDIRIVGGSLPDIDTDFQANKRDEIKSFMEQRFGKNQVCSVGTYTTLKLKQALKDVSRLESIDFKTSNSISKILDIEEGSWIDIFRTAMSVPKVKEFILSNPEIIESIRLILNQPKSKSIHACATIIFPNEKEAYRWIPIRKEIVNNEEVFITEWEGKELEIAGFLKEDILGLKQLDKFAFILELIKQNHGIDIELNEIPLEDKQAYNLFSEGFCGDIFHFGSKGLTKYCKELKPSNIDDLTAAISLYRPGAMDNNFHNEYVFRKNKDKKVDYYWGCQEVTEKTYGLIVLQETVMMICNRVADFSLLESDNVRRAMGKKDSALLDSYKSEFINRAIKKGCPEMEAVHLWEILDKFSGYAFCLAHAVAYAVTGYRCQWLKVHYPIEYWTSAFEFDVNNEKKSSASRFISEINRTTSEIGIKPPHINYSYDRITSSFEKKEMFWALSKVKQVGDVALAEIINVRNTGGEFFSLDDFLHRVDKRVINKRVVINLILSGAFDEIEGVKNKTERKNLISKYFEFMSIKPDIQYSNKDLHWWELMQKYTANYGDIDYKKLIRSQTEFKPSNFIDGFDLQFGDKIGNEYVIAGIISVYNQRVTKKKEAFASIELDCNNELINVLIWPDTFKKIKHEFSESPEGKILVMNAVVKYDAIREINSVQTLEKTIVKII